MRITILFLLTINWAAAAPTNSLVHYLVVNSLNNREISFNQTTLNFIENIFENEPTTPFEIRHKILQNFISYGIQQGFNHKTILGHFKCNNSSSKSLPSLEKIADPFDVSKNIFKIKLDPKKFTPKSNEKLIISIEKPETSKEPVISMTPAMKALLKEMSQKNLTIQ